MKMEENKKMKPTFVLPCGHISKQDIKQLRDNGFCVVEAKYPEKIRFLDPPPFGYTQQEQAAIQLTRKLLAEPYHATKSMNEIKNMLIYILVEGSPIDPIKKLAK